MAQSDSHTHTHTCVYIQIHWCFSGVSLTHRSEPRISPASATQLREANIQGTAHCETHYSQLTHPPAGNTGTHTQTCIHQHTEQGLSCFDNHTAIQSTSITILISIHGSVVSICHCRKKKSLDTHQAM